MIPKDLRVGSSYGTNKIDACDVCLRAKQARTQFIVRESNASDLFEIIHYDIWGFYRIPSFCGAHHFLTIVDYVNGAVWLYLMREKREVTSILQNFIIMVMNRFKTNMKIARIDNGLEFRYGPLL